MLTLLKGAQALVFRAAMGFFKRCTVMKQALGVTATFSLDPVHTVRDFGINA